MQMCPTKRIYIVTRSTRINGITLDHQWLTNVFSFEYLYFFLSDLQFHSWKKWDKTAIISRFLFIFNSRWNVVFESENAESSSIYTFI